MKLTKSLLLCLGIPWCWHTGAQVYDTNNPVVQFFAGSGTAGYLNGNGAQANFSYPQGVVADTSSNLFVLDANNSRIRKITPDATVSTFVGGGSGSLPGFGTTVSLNPIAFGAMVIDHQNTIWVTCYYVGLGGGLLRIGSDASAEFLGYSGVSQGSGVCVDSANNIYFSTVAGNQIFRLATNGSLTVFAGSGSSGATDGNAGFSSFFFPKALATDAADNVYVWDSNNSLIRRIDQQQNVTTIAGNGSVKDADGVGLDASFANLWAMCADNWGNIILACGSSIRRLSAATNVTTIAGSFSQSSYANGAGALARFAGATGVCLSQGMIFVADSANQRVRFISFNPQPQPVTGADLSIASYAGVTLTGLVGRTYQVQSSLDMSTWRTEATLLLTASPYLWIDQHAIGGNKFYRAFLLP